MREAELYRPVIEWFRRFLQERHRKSKIAVYDTSQRSLSSFLHEYGYAERIPRWDTYEIHIDITGIIEGSSSVDLAFIECKIHMVSLKDVSQLLGYSLVAKPLYSLLVSTHSLSASLWKLIETDNNLEILKYADDKIIRIYQWDVSKNEVIAPSVVPHGMHLLPK